MEPLYRGHIGTLETVLYIEVILNSEAIVQWNLSIKDIEVVFIIYTSILH